MAEAVATGGAIDREAAVASRRHLIGPHRDLWAAHASSR